VFIFKNALVIFQPALYMASSIPLCFCGLCDSDAIPTDEVDDAIPTDEEETRNLVETFDSAGLLINVEGLSMEQFRVQPQIDINVQVPVTVTIENNSTGEATIENITTEEVITGSVTTIN
jgi:hypothetical protein